MSLVSTEWLANNINNLKVLDCSWHMPSVNRDSYNEYINAPTKPLKNKTCPKGYPFDHLTTKSIKENAQTDRNMYKKPN